MFISQDHNLTAAALVNTEMIRALFLVACATAAAAQFNVKHTQYGTSPPVYPSPRTCGAGGWDAALEKAQAFVAELTIEEKAQMVTGTQRLVKDVSWLTDVHRYSRSMCWQHCAD